MGKAWILPIEGTLAQVTEVEGLAALQAASKAGEGVILLAPHLGNWEIFGYFACEGIVSGQKVGSNSRRLIAKVWQFCWVRCRKESWLVSCLIKCLLTKAESMLTFLVSQRSL